MKKIMILSLALLISFQSFAIDEIKDEEQTPLFEEQSQFEDLNLDDCGEAYYWKARRRSKLKVAIAVPTLVGSLFVWTLVGPGAIAVIAGSSYFLMSGVLMDASENRIGFGSDFSRIHYALEQAKNNIDTPYLIDKIIFKALKKSGYMKKDITHVEVEDAKKILIDAYNNRELCPLVGMRRDKPIYAVYNKHDIIEYLSNKLKSKE